MMSYDTLLMLLGVCFMSEQGLSGRKLEKDAARDNFFACFCS